MSNIDLNNPPPGHSYSVSVNREETDGERLVRLAREFLTFLLAAAALAGIYYIAYVTTMDPKASAEAQKWAFGFLTATGGGVIGYLIRR